MTELIRDTAFGHIVRFVSRGKFLQYAEERDPSIYTRYLDEKKSGYLAHHGDTNPPEDGDESGLSALGGARTREERRQSRRASSASSQTQVGDDVNHASGVKVDQEKGKDMDVVSWYGDNDPEVSLQRLVAALCD
jgi:DHA1 family multidrug resistance protein-like MFS transporter